MPTTIYNYPQYTDKEIEAMEEHAEWQAKNTYVDEELYEKRIHEAIEFQNKIEAMGFELKKNYHHIRSKNYNRIREQCRKVRRERWV